MALTSPPTPDPLRAAWEEMLTAATDGLDARARAAVDTALATAAPPLIAGAAQVVGALETTAARDPVAKRWIIWGLTAAVGVGALIVLVAYLLGNGPAGHIIGGVPAVAVALGFWHSSTDAPPKPRAAGVRS